MHIKYQINQIVEILGCSIKGSEIGDVQSLLIDSRKLSNPSNCLFIAIKGLRQDGHLYIPELYMKGVRMFLVSNLTFKPELFPDASFLIVKDTIVSLQELCTYHRLKFSYPVLGITGSNGKTIVKEWLFQMLEPDFDIVRSPKSYNSQVGVPLSVWEMSEENNFAIFEAGISKPDEMSKLACIIKPTLGIFTNIGEPHSENFPSNKEKVKEKLKLFENCKKLIYCKDYDEINLEMALGETLNPACVFFTWSRRNKADLVISRVSKKGSETEISGVYNFRFIKIIIPFIDDASIENAIHCWAFMLSEGYDNESIESRIKYLTPIEMRLELKEGLNNCSIINDSYNSDLGSLGVALDFLNQQVQNTSKVLILSDILQSGKSKELLYGEVARMVKSHNVNKIIGIGKDILSCQNMFQAPKEFYKTTEDFLAKANSNDFQNNAILLKGSRAFSFEKITKFLQQKAHETVLEINLDAMVHNLNHYRFKLNPETKIMAMVKAFSYGSGGYEIASLLQFHRVDYLTVAYADEGLELRKAGITMPIMVMNPEEQSFEMMIKYQLEPEIYSFRILNLFEKAVLSTANKQFDWINIHIKLDTGMHRLGFEPEELNNLIIRLINAKKLRVVSVFSHLAASDDRNLDNFTNGQINLFRKLSDEIANNLSYSIKRHILNTSGVSNFPDAQFDMVRLGIGLYGISSDPKEQRYLKNVSNLKSTISQIKQIKPGESVGYGRLELAKSHMIAATVPIGYADGLNRVLGNRKGKMYLNGKFAPIIGNICMDMCMIDITEITASEGDSVTIFGDDFSISEYAKIQGTIPYEILTSVSRRVKRVYFRD